MSNHLTSRIGLLLVAASLGFTRQAVAATPQLDEPATEVAVEVTAVTDDLVATSAECDESDQLNYTPAVARESTTDTSVVLVAAAKCKRCQDRPWCGCTYNGLPRVSCNPCCYGNLGIQQICLD